MTIEAYNHLISLSRLRGVPEAGAGLTAADAAPMQLRGCRGKAERDGRRGGGHWPRLPGRGPTTIRRRSPAGDTQSTILHHLQSTVYMWAVVYILYRIFIKRKAHYAQMLCI